MGGGRGSVVKAPEIYSLSKFPVFDTVLTIAIILHIRSLELVHPT